MSSTRELARPTAAPQPKRRTPTPGAVAEYAADGSPVTTDTAPALLVIELAAYGVTEPVVPRGDWADADWECLARRAGA